MKELRISSPPSLGALAAVCFERYETALLDDSRRGLSILGVDPPARYRWHRGEGTLSDRDRTRREDDPFSGLRELLGAPRPERLPPAADRAALPFTGGLLGYCGYDGGRAVEAIPDANPPASSLPDIAFDRHDLVFVLDQSADALRVFISDVRDETARVDLARALVERARGRETPRPFCPDRRVPAVSAIARDDYLAAVEAIREEIRDGEVYQVNLTQRLLVPCAGDPVSVFLALRERHPAAYGALMRVDDAWILSSSPECFLRVEGDLVETRPIKGTAPRGLDPEEDARRARALQESAKDRAELAMIVDLMRNDLNRVCVPGSVLVPEHAALQSVPTVHHLVSRVTGQLDGGRDVFDLLRATHPGGSITGAPKIAAMRSIDRLEPLRRGVYTGGIGYIGQDGRAELNIAIRTMVLEAGWAHVHGGGGIVIDSDPKGEYDESLAKVRGLLEVLGAEVRE